jgi:hypothetical protein
MLGKAMVPIPKFNTDMVGTNHQNMGDFLLLYQSHTNFLGSQIPGIAPRHVSARSITKRCWGEGCRSRALMAACGLFLGATRATSEDQMTKIV